MSPDFALSPVRAQPADIVLRARLRLALVIVSPLHWRNPDTGVVNITGAKSFSEAVPPTPLPTLA